MELDPNSSRGKLCERGFKEWTPRSELKDNAIYSPRPVSQEMLEDSLIRTPNEKKTIGEIRNLDLSKVLPLLQEYGFNLIKGWRFSKEFAKEGVLKSKPDSAESIVINLDEFRSRGFEFVENCRVVERRGVNGGSDFSSDLCP